MVNFLQTAFRYLVAWGLILFLTVGAVMLVWDFFANLTGDDITVFLAMGAGAVLCVLWRGMRS